MALEKGTFCLDTSPEKRLLEHRNQGRQKRKWLEGEKVKKKKRCHEPLTEGRTRALSRTCRVFPRPMQWARMHPEPDDFSVFFIDSQQQSQMNCTPGTRSKGRQTKRLSCRSTSERVSDTLDAVREEERCYFLFVMNKYKAINIAGNV